MKNNETLTRIWLMHKFVIANEQLDKLWTWKIKKKQQEKSLLEN
jgi:hypothetical protein